MDITFSLFPKMTEIPRNPLTAELVEDAIYWNQTFGDDYGTCYATIIDLCLAGF